MTLEKNVSKFVRTIVHQLLLPGRLVNQPEASDVQLDSGRFPVPFSTARRFYLPQWVAFDHDDNLLVGSVQEAEKCIVALQRAIHMLQDEQARCPSVVADEAYQRKRAGLIEQLIHQGGALARYYTRQIITKIRTRAEAGTLNRGLRLSLPYFENDDLSIHLYPVEVIPDGRIMFTPAFVVRAMQFAAAKVRRDPQFSVSSRQNLLDQLICIENAFNKQST
jgi:hypothetical protein